MNKTAFKKSKFIKWVGGKNQLLSDILPKIPIINGTYYEPFMGSAAVFFRLAEEKRIKKAVISDLNIKLVSLFNRVKSNPKKLILDLTKIQSAYHKSKKKEDFYYECRDQFNGKDTGPYDEETLFIFLNKTCFNGLYRENKKGEFNVPWSKKESINIIQENEIYHASKLLQIATIKHQGYDMITPKAGDFTYFDPPYRPITSAGFTTYNKDGFNDEEQKKLAIFFTALKGQALLSNSDPENLDPKDSFFLDIYKKHTIVKVYAIRSINSDGTNRSAVSELLITKHTKK